jgi:3-hydroxy-9,10-secoandrosta-1,3,5(10)-triene-9,17-dione monooxygenase
LSILRGSGGGDFIRVDADKGEEVLSVLASSEIEPGSSANDVVERARAIVGDLRARAREAETLRRVPPQSVDLLRANGLLRVIQAPECGGLGLSMRAHVDVVATVAEGCSSTAWVLGVWHAHSWLMGHYSPQAQRDVYGGDPDTIVSAVIGPRGRAVRQTDGSFVLSGVWPFASGCEHAAWLMLGAELFDEAGTKLDEADLLVPVGGVTINDDWFVAGLQGTGSSSVRAVDVVVPPHRILSMSSLMTRTLGTYDDPQAAWLTHAQAVPVLTLCLCAGTLGIARAAVTEFTRAVRGKSVAYTPHAGHEWIPNQIALGRAATLVHAADLLLHSAADEIDQYARRDAPMSLELRGRIRMECSQAVRFCLEATDLLFMNGGASSLGLASPVQRAARDLRATNMHGLLLLDAAAELYGRILFGLEPNTPIV